MAQGSRQGNDDQGSNGRPAGLALAGGRSSRFGSDKAVALLAERPLLAWVVSALRETCGAVAVSAAPGGGAEELARSMPLPVLTDDPAHAKGPLAGLASGLAWARAAGFERLVTLPCDTPLVGAREIAALLGALGDAPAAYAATGEGPQPLCAVWRTDLAGMLGVRLTLGRHPAARDFLAEIDAVEVGFVDPGPFRNANSKDALAALALEIGGGPSGFPFEPAGR